MPKKNDTNRQSKSPEQDKEPSPLKNLFRSHSNDDQDHSGSDGGQMKDIFDDGPSDGKKRKYHKNVEPLYNEDEEVFPAMDKLKSRFQNFVKALQQQPEENFDDDFVDEPTPKATKKMSSQPSDDHSTESDMKIYQPKKQRSSPSNKPPKAEVKLPKPPKEPPKAEVKPPEPPKEQPKAEAKPPEPPKEQPKAEAKPPEPPKEQPKAEAKPPEPPKEPPKAEVKPPEPPKEQPKAEVKPPEPPQEPPKAEHDPILRPAIPLTMDVKSVTSMVEERLKAETLAQQSEHNNAYKKKNNHNKNSDPFDNLSSFAPSSRKSPIVITEIKLPQAKNEEKLQSERADDIAEPQKTEEEKRLEKENTIYRHPDPVKQSAPNRNETDDDIKIIPWSHSKPSEKSSEPVSGQDQSDQPHQPQPQSKLADKYKSAPVGEEKDFSEGYTFGVTYHESKNPQFIVMAGKFTKTLRNEYEYVRVYNKAQAEKKVQTEKADRQADEKNGKETAVSSVQPKQPQPKSTRRPRPERQQPVRSNLPKATFEPLETPKKPSAPKPTDVKQKSRQEQPKPKKMESLEGKQGAVKPAMPPMRRKKYKLPKLSLKSMFESEEEYDPEDTEIEEQTERPLLDDYNEEKDAEEIRSDIATNLRQVFVKNIILGVVAVLSVLLAIIAQLTPLFSSMRIGWLIYAIISFIMFTIAAVTSRMAIVNGLMPLRYLKANSDTAAAVASFAVAIQSITAIFTPDVYVNGTLHIYVPIAVIALLLNHIGKLLMIIRAHENFRFLTKPYAKYAGKIYTDIRNAEKMVSEFPNKKTIIGYTKRSKFMSNFLQLTYAPDPSELIAAKAAPITTGLSLLCGIVCGILKMNFVAGVSSFALTACICTPLICLLAINIPLLRLCRSTLRSGAMVTSYETVKQFCDTNAIMLDSAQLYPKGTITLSGMKAFKQSKLNDAITAGAAVMYAVDGPMCGVFDNIVQCSKNMLPRVDSVVYEDNKGLVGWVQGQRILIGNRDLLESHNVKAPDQKLEERYRDDFNEISYITVGGELIAMFVLAYKPDREIIHELRNLEENGVSFIIRTVDPNVTKESVSKKFYLYPRCITILPTGLGNICHEATSSVDERSRAYLATRGKISSFAKAVSGCIRIKSNVTFSKVLQYVAIVVGLVLVTVISFVSGFEKLGCCEMLLYMGFWALGTILVSIIKK